MPQVANGETRTERWMVNDKPVDVPSDDKNAIALKAAVNKGDPFTMSLPSGRSLMAFPIASEQEEQKG